MILHPAWSRCSTCSSWAIGRSGWKWVPMSHIGLVTLIVIQHLFMFNLWPHVVTKMLSPFYVLTIECNFQSYVTLTGKLWTVFYFWSFYVIAVLFLLNLVCIPSQLSFNLLKIKNLSLQVVKKKKKKTFAFCVIVCEVKVWSFGGIFYYILLKKVDLF